MFATVISFSFALGFGEEVADSVDAISPQRLELVEDLCRLTDCLDVRSDELLAAVSLLGDDVRSLEHGHMLLYGGKAHVVAAGERRDRALAVHRSGND